MSVRKIFILLGHPDKAGICGAIADTYETAARSAGHEVTRMNVGEMRFDPILHEGYRAIQALEPDLLTFQEQIKKADHFVVIYPVWWSGMPALLKGLFDRSWLPGSAFRYIKTKSGEQTIWWHRLYYGKSARIIVTSGSPKFFVRLWPGSVVSDMRWGILWFAGFSTSVTWFGSAEHMSDTRRARIISYISKLGRGGV